MSTEPIAAISPVEAPPIDSLAELRRQHSTLLQRDVAGSGTAKPSPGELLGFLMSAKKLGRLLEDDDSREIAQGIMDFWIASLLSQAPQAAEGTRPFTLEPHDECSAALVTDDAHQLRTHAVEVARRADDLLPSAAEIEGANRGFVTKSLELLPQWMQPITYKLIGSKEDANMLQRLLLRFVRLKEKSLEAYAVPVQADDDIWRQPQAQQLLKQLMEAGVVRSQDAAAGAPAGYVLAHESLLVKWGLLTDFIIQRKAFRELTRGWENSGRQPSALLSTGTQMDQAIDFPHLDASEQQFLEASRRAGEKARNSLLSFALTGMIVMLVMITWLWLSRAELSRANAEAEQKTALALTKISQIKSVEEQLRKVTGLPEDAITILKEATEEVNVGSKSMAEVFVGLGTSQKTDGLAAKCIAELEREGFVIPARRALPRLNVVDRYDKTEVRYFHASDEALYAKVVAALGRAGIPADRINKEDKTKDPTAPRRFVQISISEFWTNEKQ